MPEITLDVPVVTTTTESVVPEVKEITLFTGDASTPAAISVSLSAKDAAGNWRTDVQPIQLRREGDAAKALISAIVDEQAILPAVTAALEVDDDGDGKTE